MKHFWLLSLCTLSAQLQSFQTLTNFKPDQYIWSNDSFTITSNSISRNTTTDIGINWMSEARGGRLAVLDTQDKIDAASIILPQGTSLQYGRKPIAAIGGKRNSSGLTWIDGSIVDQNSYLWTSGNPESEPYLAITADGELLDISSSDIGQFNYYGYIIEIPSN